MDKKTSSGLNQTAKGAATGAIIGSVVPGIGTGIGAGVGAGVSLIGQGLSGTGFFASDEGDPYAFQPTYPSYNPVYDPNTMSMSGKTAERLAGLQMDTRGADKFRKQALRLGPSQWAGLQNQAIDEQTINARERAKQEALSATTQAQSDLAMHGGLSAGARERAANVGQRNLVGMSQQAGRAGAGQRLQVGINDEQNRIAQLSQLPSIERGIYDVNFGKFQEQNKANLLDMQNTMSEQQRRNDYNMKLAEMQDRNRAAEQQARAIAASGGGGFLSDLFGWG